MRQILHPAPCSYDGRIVDILHQKFSEFLCEIEIFFGEKVESFDGFLTEGRSIFDISLVQLEYRTVERSHHSPPVDHFIDILVDHFNRLPRIVHGIRPLLHNP